MVGKELSNVTQHEKTTKAYVYKSDYSYFFRNNEGVVASTANNEEY